MHKQKGNKLLESEKNRILSCSEVKKISMFERSP